MCVHMQGLKDVSHPCCKAHRSPTTPCIQGEGEHVERGKELKEAILVRMPRKQLMRRATA